jgi:predicted transposase YdaD
VKHHEAQLPQTLLGSGETTVPQPETLIEQVQQAAICKLSRNEMIEIITTLSTAIVELFICPA